MMRELIMRKPFVILATLFCNNVNAEWGEQWGSMVWGQSSTNVPMMGGFGQLIFFGLLLVIGVFVTKRWGLIKTIPAIALLSLMPFVVDADEIELNTFQNGQVADADEVNENFTNLKTAIDNHGHGSVGGGDSQDIISAVSSNTDSIVANDGDIQANTDSIVANDGDIQANTDSIVANDGDIQANTDSIVANDGDIQANTDSIVANDGDFGCRLTLLQIAAARWRFIQANTDSIAANVLAISDAG